MEYRAALLASHGIASLALDYLTPQITKENGKMVDNNYFEVSDANHVDSDVSVLFYKEWTNVVPRVSLLQAAYRFLEQHPQVIDSRIGILGLSFGTSIALKMAVYSQVFKVRRLDTHLSLKGFFLSTSSTLRNLY